MTVIPWLAQVLLEHQHLLPSCDAGQGHLHVPRATCVSPQGHRHPLHQDARGGTSLPTGGSQCHQLESHGTRRHEGRAQAPLCRAPTCSKWCPKLGFIPPPPKGCSRLTREQDLALKEEKSPRAGSGEALTLLKLDLQDIRGVRRGGRVAGLRVEAGGSLILQGWGGRQGKVNAVGTANIASVPRPRHASPTAPRPHPKARGTRRAPAQSSAGAGGGPGNKGAGEIRQFFPST